jgi:hypothetical protein
MVNSLLSASRLFKTEANSFFAKLGYHQGDQASIGFAHAMSFDLRERGRNGGKQRFFGKRNAFGSVFSAAGWPGKDCPFMLQG